MRDPNEIIEFPEAPGVFKIALSMIYKGDGGAYATRWVMIHPPPHLGCTR